MKASWQKTSMLPLRNILRGAHDDGEGAMGALLDCVELARES